MAAAIAAYAGPVTKCPPGKARGGTGKVKLLIRPRYRAKPPRRYTAAAMTRGAEINRQRTPKLTIIAAPCGPTTRSILFEIKSRCSESNLQPPCSQASSVWAQKTSLSRIWLSRPTKNAKQQLQPTG